MANDELISSVLRDYGMAPALPIINNLGQFQVGGDLPAHIQVMDAISPISNFNRFKEAAQPVVEPNLMGGAEANIRDKYGVAMEGVGLLGLAPDVTDIARVGLRAARPALGRAAQTVTNLVDEAVQGSVKTPLSIQEGKITFHGSPHKFSKFQHKFMGSGEGAQAYGWGTYLADTPGVAKTYIPRDFDAEDLMMARYKAAEAADNLTEMEIFERAMLHDSSDDIAKYFQDPDVARYHNKADVDAALNKLRDIEKDMAGNLYEVDLPDEQIAKMLDWDAPLSEQPESVLEAAKRIDPNLSSKEPHWVPDNGQPPQHWTELADSIDDLPTVERVLNKGDEYHHGKWMPYGDYLASKMTGGEFYQEVASGGNWGKQVRGLNRGDAFGKEASEELNKLGIPGIKYWDGGSRAAGEGTRNYVVFDENIMTILKRNDKNITDLLESP